MSLIYDYLKIHGNKNLEGKPDVEIPSSLKRSIPDRPTIKNLPAVIGICLAAGLLLFFIYNRVFTPGEEVTVIDKPESLPQVQTVQIPPQSPPVDSAIVAEPVSVTDRLEETAPALAESVPEPMVEPLQEPKPRVPEKTIQEMLVFPEPWTAERVSVEQAPPVEQTFQVYTEEPAVIQKKIPPPLELHKTTLKRGVTEQVPVYPEPETPVADKAAEQQPAEAVDHYETTETAAYIPVQEAPDVPAGIYTPWPEEISLDKSKKFYQAGLQAQMRGDHRAAEAYYSKTLDADPYHLDAMVNLSALYVQQQRYDQAEGLLRDIFQADPENSKALVNMGVINLFQKDIVRAEENFQAALAANPLEENALINLAYIAEQRGDMVATERYYRLLLQLSPDNIEVLLSYGHFLEADKRYLEAVALYGDCLKLDSVTNDQLLYDRIKQRMRLLKGAIRR
jgi:Tfp pilus assembly protein PilF